MPSPCCDDFLSAGRCSGPVVVVCMCLVLRIMARILTCRPWNHLLITDAVARLPILAEFQSVCKVSCLLLLCVFCACLASNIVEGNLGEC